MEPATLIAALAHQQSVFQQLFAAFLPAAVPWKPSPEQWSAVEIACHLRDEEREDFRTRVRYALEHPEQAPPPIDPVGWVTERAYAQTDFATAVAEWLDERRTSLQWLRQLPDVDWQQGYTHPDYGHRSAHFYLTNWLAHDYLHQRQLIRLQYAYLQEHGGQAIAYAGNWV